MRMRMKRSSGLFFLLTTCCLLPTGLVWADEPANASLKADVEVLKARLTQLEAQLSGTQTLSKEAPSTAGKSGLPTVQLPSGLQGLQISGYADVSYILNMQHADAVNVNPSGSSTKNGGNRGRVFDTQSNGFTPQAFELVLEKPETNEMPIGFRTDLFFGDDAELIHSNGLGATSAGAGSPAQPFDLQQAYLTVKAPVGAGIDFKVGKFVTLLRADVIESPANWNFSRSYLFGYAIPFTHTGALATYPLGEWGSVSGGIVNGWDIVDDNNQFKTFLGQLNLTPIKSVTLTLNGITGAERAGDNRNQRAVVDFVGTWQPCEKLTLMSNYDYGHESSLAHGAVTTAGFDTSNWQGLALYAKYNLTPKWSLAGRWEWFDDMGNTRTGFTSRGGTTESRINFNEWTFTSQWTLHEHVLARLEYRHDSADERVFFRGKSKFLDSQDTIAAEMIYHF